MRYVRVFYVHLFLVMTLYPQKLIKQVLKMLFVAMALHFFEALLMLIHLWRCVLKSSLRCYSKFFHCIYIQIFG